ncbi:cysteine proteinase [Morchella conica CCBAS932]|uniref:ubiquitinyl hydrolase 1 n=1 Tax=Morchella conica CCBAS932 TaxID=1392247 RepID=A0A3N4L5V5_9PEZI|nr:cysteine proteinase [Morchella conica CCBAS932]
MNSNTPPHPLRAPPAMPSAKSQRIYPHISDLHARSEGLHPTGRSIKSWVDEAKVHWRQATWHYEFGRLDSAYCDFIMANTIILETIPKCVDYPTFVSGQRGMAYMEWIKLKEELKAKTPLYLKVKEEIKKDNELSGVQSANAQLEAERVAERVRATLHPGTGVSQDIPPKTKPEVRAKPEYLSMGKEHSRTGSGAKSPQLNGQVIVPTYGKSSPNALDSTLDLNRRLERLTTTTSRSSSPASLSQPVPTTPPTVVHGPREMPTKLPPLNVNAMPTLPPPTYSPATSHGGMLPSRNTSLPSTDGNGASRQPKPNFPNDTIISVDTLYNYLSKESQVTILLLDVRSREEFDEGHIYARSVVCIEPIVLRDGMSEDDLDRSFVLAPSKEQELFSARDKYDIVVYYDQSMANKKFLSGLTQDEHQIALRSLHMAIYDFAFRKRLQRAPMLLVGGLDAWIELVGKHSLKTSDTAEFAKSEPTSRPSSRVGRQSISLEKPRSGIGVIRDASPSVSENRLSLAKRRQDRDPQRGSMPLPVQRVSYGRKQEPTPVDPINIEEEQKWMERLQREREPLTISVPPVSPHPDADVESKKRRRGTSIVAGNDNFPTGYVRTMEEFFQRYPAQPSMSPIPPTPISAGTPITPRGQHTIIDHPFYGFTDVRNPDFNPPPTPIRPPPAVPRKSYSGVSERLAPPIPPPLPPAPEIPPRPPKIPLILDGESGSPFRTIGSINIGKTGLKNLGNTCYMNAILQCMSGTIPLSRYFLDGSYRSHINKDNPLGSRGVLAEAFASVVKNLWSGEYKFISPVTIKDVSGRLNEMFKSDDQQDAQEYLEFLLDGLHEDLNPYANRTKLRPLTDEEERRRETLPQQTASHLEWQRYIHSNFSVVVNWFQGQLSSRLMCLTCGITSTTYSGFMYLSLPIPSKRGGFTLADCLEEFVKEEVLEKDDAWHCPNCKKARKATKKLTITRLPHILIIHLKRFTNRGLWRDKLNTMVQFPLKDLNLTKYVPPLLPRGALGPNAPEPSAEVTPPFMYDLYGVCNHYGTLNGGHYTSFVRNNHQNAWNHFDDSKASFVDDSAVVSRNAYVLFWVRSNVM